MHYWDASAIVPLLVQENATPQLRPLAAEQGIVTWVLSHVEVASAIERRCREGALSDVDRSQTLAMLDELRTSWTEILGPAVVGDRSRRLLATHPLRAADALQLAAALVAVEDRPKGHVFVCGDTRLTSAASREGFTVHSGN